MIKLFGTFLAVGLFLASVSVVAAQGPTGHSVPLRAQNNSGVSGTATLTDLGGGRMRVAIRVTAAGNNNMLAHIHEGTCANLDPRPEHSLNNVVNGTSTTELTLTAADVADLAANPHAINLHKSPQEASVYVACGDLPRLTAPTPGKGGAAAPAQRPAAAAPAQRPAALPRTGDIPIGALALIATSLAGIGVGLRRFGR